MFVRPHPHANHAAWQVGNVIVGDVYMVGTRDPGRSIPDSTGRFPRVAWDTDPSRGFPPPKWPGWLLAQAELLLLFESVRAALSTLLAI